MAIYGPSRSSLHPITFLTKLTGNGGRKLAGVVQQSLSQLVSANAGRPDQDERSPLVLLRIVERHLLVGSHLTAAPLERRVLSFPLVGFFGTEKWGGTGLPTETLCEVWGHSLSGCLSLTSWATSVVVLSPPAASSVSAGSFCVAAVPGYDKSLVRKYKTTLHVPGEWSCLLLLLCPPAINLSYLGMRPARVWVHSPSL